MRLLRSFALALSLAGPILAHHEASSTSDWYKQLIGVPAHELSWTAPSFQSSGSQELILTTTESNVLAALHPENGTVRKSLPRLCVFRANYRRVEICLWRRG